jgi:hypothetical protein
VTALRLIASALLLTVCVSAQTPPAQTPPQEPEIKDLAGLMASLPKATVKPLDAPSALFYGALPLTCIDDLQARPNATRPYFWQPTYKIIDGYSKVRSFYGCNDWQSAVSATWTLVTLLKKYPDLSSGPLIREKLTAHLGRDNLDGELAYFKTAGNAQRPYGYAWFLKLYAELATWTDPDGARYADNSTALARFFTDGIVSFLVDLERPNRAGTNANSALTLNLLLDYVDRTRDMTIKRAVGDAARRLFLTDTSCATNTEAASPEMVSPCLEEATVMSRVLDAAAFGPWFDKFLPAAQSTQFKPLRSIQFDAVGTGRGRGGNRGAGAPAAGRGANANAGTIPPPANPPPTTNPPTAANPPAAGAPVDPAAIAAAGRGGPAPNPRAQWIGLAFTRAEAYSRLAASLSPTDPRAAVFKRLSDIHAEQGQKEVVTAAAFDAPWVGAFAVSYLAMTGGAK